MHNFKVFKDNEKIIIKKKKLQIAVRKPIPLVNNCEKKIQENRGILQTFNNGVRQIAKKPKLCYAQKIETIIRLDEDNDSKEKQKTPEIINDDIIKIEKSKETCKFLATNLCNKNEDISISNLVFDSIEYKEEIWSYLKELELRFPIPKTKYMLKQLDLSWESRRILVDWLASVAHNYKLSNQTFQLSVNYIDRFLTHMNVMKTKFQLVGAAAMLLAGKIEEIYPIDVKEWSYLTGDSFSPRQIMKMEHLIAKVLQYKMLPPTTCTFIEHFCVEHNLDTRTKNLAMYFSELSLLEGDECLTHLPSELASASIALARYTLLKSEPWPKKLKEHSGYSVQHLSPVLKKHQSVFLDSPNKEQQEIQKKYKSDCYEKVGLVKPRKLNLDDFEDENN